MNVPRVSNSDRRFVAPAGGETPRPTDAPSPGEASVRVRAFARELGFDAIGIARADVELDRDVAHYDAFVAAGMHGTMGWLAQNRGARGRLDGDAILPGAKSVVCLARSYGRSADEETGDPDLALRVARYARGRDYHKFLRRRLRRLAAFFRSLGSPDAPVRARPLCDEEPVLERAWAARAGLGFVGKNGLLIAPGLGSFVLLGEVVTTLELEPSSPMRERCGGCTRCLDACPTGAFVRPFVLDPRLCIAYLTIELRGPVPSELREPLGEHLFGCDDCQTVCPFNAGASLRGARTKMTDPGPFVPLAQWSLVSLLELLTMGEPRFREVAEGSPLKRAGYAGIARNAALVLGNRRDPAAAASLQRAATSHEDPGVREASAWALERLGSQGPRFL